MVNGKPSSSEDVAAPRPYKRAVVTWLAVYPSLTAVLAVVEPLGMRDAPLPVRTFVVTAVLVPIVVMVLVPLLRRLLSDWMST